MAPLTPTHHHEKEKEKGSPLYEVRRTNKDDQKGGLIKPRTLLSNAENNFISLVSTVETKYLRLGTL